MKTARSGSSPIPSTARSASKLCSWRPKALRLALASRKPRWSASQTIRPGAGAEDRPAGLVVGPQRRLQPGRLDPLDDRRALAAGDHQAVEVLEVRGGADLGHFGAELAQVRACASKSPCSARTPTRSVRLRGSAGGRPRRRDRRSRGPASPRRARSRRRRPARGRRSGWSPRRSPGRGARGRRS